VILPLIVFVSSLAGLITVARRNGIGSIVPEGMKTAVAGTLMPATAGFIFWFFTAPDPRFALFDIWTIDAVLGTLCMLAIGSGVVRRARIILASGVCLALLSNLHLGPQYYHDHFDNPAALVPKGVVVPHTTRSGLVVYRPIQTTDQCWDSPIPGTPDFDPDLRLRVPGDLSSGFVTREP
jgi:hypothetical protein